MFHYIENKEFESKIRVVCGEIMQSLCHSLKEDYGISSNFYLVGSGARNLLTQNENGAVDLDYNLEITKCYDIRVDDCRTLKNEIIKCFNSVLNAYGWSNCEDSTSSITTENRYFKKGNKTEFSIDICITTKDSRGNYYRLKHYKTGFTYYDTYVWELAPNSRDIREKVKCIKENGLWNEVRNQYLDIKNRYLRRNDYNHPSFICYIEAVNNVYNHINQIYY